MSTLREPELVEQALLTNSSLGPGPSGRFLIGQAPDRQTLRGGFKGTRGPPSAFGISKSSALARIDSVTVFPSHCWPINRNTMGPAAVHPTQRRFSCRVCRKHKSRCRRLHPDDAKCARCMLLGVECTGEQQKKVGRPRRAAASAGGSPQTPDKPGSTLRIPPITRAEGHDRPKHPGIAHSASSEGRDQPVLSRVIPPAATSVPVLPTAADGVFITAPTGPPLGMGSLDQEQIPWESSNLYQIFSLSNPDSDLGITASLDTPVMTSLPVEGPYYTPPADSLAIPGPGRAPASGLSTSDAVAKLSKINLDLHIRVAAAERAVLDLNSFIYQEGPLYIDDSTAAEFVLRASQEFLLILTRLLGSRHAYMHGLFHAPQAAETISPELSQLSPESFQANHRNPTSTPSSYPAAASEPLLAPLALTITSVFTQLISLYELLLAHLTARIERMATDPIASLPGLTFGGLPVAEPCVQGMLFSEVAVHLLERIERALGVGKVSESSEVGLLSSRQIDVLWSELDGGLGIVPGHGAMRPANVRKVFGKVGFTLKQFSLGNVSYANTQPAA